MKSAKTIILFILILLVSASTGLSEQDIKEGLASISHHDVYDTCKELSSPRFAGRLTGHRGYTEAARWVASKFQSWGLKPLDEKGVYLQAYPSAHTVIDRAEMVLLLPETEENAQGDIILNEVPLETEKDFLPLLFSDRGDNTAGLVFAGWGISAPELGYDDYENLDVKGKFLLCLRGTPDPSDDRYQKHDNHRFRMETAKKKGSLGLIYIYPNPQAIPNGDRIQGFTPAIIGEKTANLILKEKGKNAGSLKKQLLDSKAPLSIPLRTKIRYLVESRHFPEATGYNVVGYIEGSDPRLKDEFIVIGAHLDHCGEHMGLLFSGANDNASGSAVVMELAQAFSRSSHKPKRSIAFALFGGEEKGLEGSSFFAEHLPALMKKMDAMFNFDMVGEGDKIIGLVGVEPDELRTLLEDADQSLKILKGIHTIRKVGVRSSDFAPFFQRGVPCVAFISSGPHLHYHETGDTIYRINPDIMADAARLSFLCAFARANR
jgi:hypothetical protein